MTATDIANKAISHVGGSLLADLATDASQNARSIRKWYNPDGSVYSALDECLRSHAWNFATARKRQTVAFQTIEGISNGTIDVPDVFVLLVTGHGHSTGDRVYIKDSGAPDGRWYITKVDDNEFYLNDSVYSSSHESGGNVTLIPQFAYDFQHAPPADCLRVLSINADGGQLEDDGTDFLFEGGVILTNSETINLKYIKRVTTPDSYPGDFVNAFTFLLASYFATDTGGNSGRGLELRQAYENAIAPLVKARDGNEGKGRRVPPFGDSQLLQSRYGGCY